MGDLGHGDALTGQAMGTSWTFALTRGLVLSGVLITAAQAPVQAGATLQGDAANLRLSLENASTQEALNTLSRLGLKFNLPSNVGRPLNGTYAGSLRQVLSRILDGTDYILRVSDDFIDVVVLSTSATAPSTTPISITVQQTAARPTVVAASGRTAPPLSSYLSSPQPTAGQ